MDNITDHHKIINITGTNNRYMIKKLVNNQKNKKQNLNPSN